MRPDQSGAIEGVAALNARAYSDEAFTLSDLLTLIAQSVEASPPPEPTILSAAIAAASHQARHIGNALERVILQHGEED